MKRYTLKEYIDTWHNGNKTDFCRVSKTNRQHLNDKIKRGWFVLIQDDGKRVLCQPSKNEWRV